MYRFALMLQMQQILLPVLLPIRQMRNVQFNLAGMPQAVCRSNGE